MAVDDNGENFKLSPDPMMSELKEIIGDVRLGKEYHGELKPLLSNGNVFGMNLYDAKIGEKIEKLFAEEFKGKGAVRKTLKAVVSNR